MEQTDIVIVGGGICGIAVALALQRKGIQSVVLEKYDSLGSTGTSIMIKPSGWYALEQLGVADKLRRTAVLLDGCQKVFLGSGKRTQITFGDVEGGKIPEARCLKRTDLIEAMADELLPNTVQFGRHVVSMKLDSYSGCPLLELSDGTQLKAKVVIGCDGLNSTIANYVGGRTINVSSVCSVRSFTSYEEGHHFANEFLVLSIPSPNVKFGRMPMTDNLVYWFMTRDCSSQDPSIYNKPELIKQSALQNVKSFPKEIQEMIKNSDTSSMHLGQLKYRPPWDLMWRNFHKGTVVLAGDAMHAMGPFLVQGGTASLEDAVVLARCLSGVLEEGGRVERALGLYVKERRMRLVKLSTHSYLLGKLSEASSSMIRLVVICMLAIFFRKHSKFNCGEL
ncbi:unnamed protein product [Rhodiola kirilowii]